MTRAERRREARRKRKKKPDVVNVKLLNFNCELCGNPMTVDGDRATLLHVCMTPELLKTAFTCGNCGFRLPEEQSQIRLQWAFDSKRNESPDEYFKRIEKEPVEVTHKRWDSYHEA